MVLSRSLRVLVHFLSCSISLQLRNDCSISFQDTKFSQVNTLKSDLVLAFFTTYSKRTSFCLYLSHVISLLFPQKNWVCVFSSHKVAATIWYLSVFRTLLRRRLGIYIDKWVMGSINRANITFPWHKYIWGNKLEYHLPKQMWKDERSEEALPKVWKHSQCSQLHRSVRRHALLLHSEVEEYHI